MRRRRNTLVALAAVFAVLLAVYAGVTIYTGREAAPGGGTDTPDTSVTLFTATSYNEISYTHDGERLLFKWDGEAESWYFAEDPQFPLKSAGLTSIVISLKNFTALRVVDENPAELAPYGLDGEKPVLVSAVSGEGETLSFRIGGANPATGDYYFQMDGQGPVYLLAKRTAEYFSLSVNDRAELPKLPKIDAASVSEFTISMRDEQSYHFVYKENGSPTCYTDSYQWFWERADGTLLPLRQAAVKSLLDEVLQISLTSCLSYNPSEAAREFLGLGETPRYQISVSYTATYEEETEDPDAEKRTYTREETAKLSLGTFFDEDYLCAAIAPSEMVGLVEGTSLLQVIQIDIGQYAPNDVCLIRAEELTAFTAQARGGRVRVDADRTGDEAVYRIGGAEADGAAVNEFLTTLLSLKAESAAPEDPGTAAALTLVFERDRPGFERMTMELAPYDGNFYLVRFNGENSQLVNRRSVEALISLMERF